MSCVNIHKGTDFNCDNPDNRYYQHLVLINKDDVLAHNIISQGDQHRILFALKETKSGFRYSGSPDGAALIPNFSKEIDENIPQYSHYVQLPLFGASEEKKQILKRLDFANYFAAVRLTSGLVEVYGFENGLTTDDYTYSLQENFGGSVIELISRDLEDDIPYIYHSDTPGLDFENLFDGIGLAALGDFNEDFNNDFLIG